MKNSSPIEIYKISKKWNAFDYELAIEYLICSKYPIADKIIKMVIDEWNSDNFYNVLKKVGGENNLIKILLLLQTKEKDLFNYLASKWVDIGNFING